MAGGPTIDDAHNPEWLAAERMLKEVSRKVGGSIGNPTWQSTLRQAFASAYLEGAKAEALKIERHRQAEKMLDDAVGGVDYMSARELPTDSSYGSDALRDAARGISEPSGHYVGARSAGRAFEGEEDPVSALRGWWEQTAHDEVANLIAKMVEYGGLHRATDLTDIGREMVAAGVARGPLLGNGQPQEGWYQELGCYFYLVGKFSRWKAAIVEGRPVSDDTLLDIGIYVRMAQRIRAVGGWPV